jgi:hypothetical protein
MNVRPPAESPPRATPIPPPTSVNRDEKTRGHQSTQSTTATVTTPNLEKLEVALIQATSRVESLSTVVADQNRKIEVLVQDNTDLRDEIRNLSQTFQRSKRDLQMVENTINKMTVELKTKFEKMLEKSEGRIQGPIDRLLEELGRMRANPPAPVHVSGITTFPPNTPFTADPAAESEGSWTPREDYGFNKLHYQDNYEHHGQPVRVARYSSHLKNLSLKDCRTITTVGATIAGTAGVGARPAEATQGTVHSFQTTFPRTCPFKTGFLYSCNRTLPLPRHRLFSQHRPRP